MRLIGALCAATLSCSIAAAPPTIDSKRGGSAVIAAPGLLAGAQLALIPGGPYLKSSVALQSPASAVTSAGHFAFVAAGAEGLQVFDISPDAQPRLVATLRGRGKITQVVLRDGYAYLADSVSALLIVDVHDPQQPQQLARIALEGPLDALSIDQGRAYLLNGNRFAVFDVSQPRAPFQIAAAKLPAAGTVLQVADGYAYVVLPQKSLSVVDVRELSAIHEVSRFRGEVRDVVVAQGRAYLANGSIGLTVLDVSEPKSPRWLGSINHIGTALALRYEDGYVALRNDRAEVMLIDARNPALPKVVGVQPAPQAIAGIALAQKQVLAASDLSLDVMDFSVPVPNVVSIGANFGGSRRAVIRDNILFVADWFSGLHMYDISEPGNPRHLSNYHTQGSSKGVLVRGDYAFVADDDHGIQILDIKNPQQPRKISEVATRGLAYTMKLAGDYLYLADHRGGFDIINVADIQHPVVVGSAPTGGKAWAVEVINNLAYIAADKAGLLVFDVSDPAQPKQIAAYDVGGAAEDVVIRDHLAYVACFDNGLHVLDISQPLQAHEIGHLATPANARGIALDGHYAYVADWVSGIQVVDIANPAQPVLAGSYDTSGWSWGVNVQGHYAYVLDWWGGIAVLDISNPAAPTLAGAYHARGLTQDVVVRDSYAYVADGSNGLQIFDIKNSLNPIWMAGVDIVGDAQSVWLEKNIAYLAAGTGGLLAVDITNPFEPHRLKQYAMHTDLVRAQGKFVYAAEKQHGVSILDSTSGQKTAWYAAAVNDIWPDGRRLLLATPDGVEIVGVGNPAHPHLIKRLPQRAELVRLQRNLLVLYERDTGISLYDYVTLKLLGRINPGEEIVDLQISGKRLYASGKLSGLLEFDVSNARRPALKSAYPAASRVTKFSVFSGAVFMAGNDTLVEVRLLPDVMLSADKNGDIKVDSPAQMPLGSYHVLALDAISGKRTLYYDALRVAMPQSNKPRFSLQDLERAMRERGLKPSTYH